MVLLSAQGMDVSAIAKVPLTSEDRVREVIRNVKPMGPVAVPKYRGGRAPEFTLAHRRESKKIATSPGRPGTTWTFSTWSLPELAEFLSPMRHWPPCPDGETLSQGLD